MINSTLLNNLLIYSQSNAEALWAHLQTFIRISGPVLIFTNYQRTVMFQISYNQNLAFQITEPDSSYMRLYRNNYNISLFLQIDNLLNSLTQSI